MKTADKLDIAEEMLDAAICEYLDARRCFAAINLAGVAQELFGKEVQLRGQTSSIREVISTAKRVAELEGKGELVDDKTWMKIAGTTKNSIKHFDSGNDRFVTIDHDAEARYAIGNAIVDGEKVGMAKSAHVTRFYEAMRDLGDELRRAGQLPG